MIRRSLNGETRLSTPQPSVHESIVCGGEPGELKHLVPGGRERNIDSVSSGERKRKSPNRDACIAGFGLRKGSAADRRTALEQPAREGESPVSEVQGSPAGSRVPRDTGNPVGRSGDHSVRLNTTPVTDSA